MSRAVRLSDPATAMVRSVTGAAAEPARLAAADAGTQPWRAWRVWRAVLGPHGLSIEDAERGASLHLEVLIDGRPASLTAEQAMPTWSHVLVTAGEILTLELAKRGPRDALIRVAAANGAQAPTTIDLAVILRSHASGPDVRAPQPRLAWETTGAAPGAAVVRLDVPDGRPWWLVDAQPGARLDPPTAEPGPGSAASSSLRHRLVLGAGERADVRLRLSEADEPRSPIGVDAEATLAVRARESDAWLDARFPVGEPGSALGRRLAAELLTHEPPSRLAAALDAVALATLDPRRARAMLLDSLAAWAHDADEPTDAPGTAPLEAWATLRVHELLVRATGRPDAAFLEEACSRLLTATSWWVDRLDPDGRSALHGGLPAIDGPRVLPRGVADHGADLAHADGAAWLAVHTLGMLELATTIAGIDRDYQDMAVTFLDTVVTMIDALDGLGGGIGMWDQERGMYLDVARSTDGAFHRIPLRSLVSLLPLLAVTVIPGETLERRPVLAARIDATLGERPELSGSIIRGHSGRRDRGDVLVSVVNRTRLVWALEHVLDPEGFLSPFGIRTLSRCHLAQPARVELGGTVADIRYRPAGTRDTDGGTLWQGQVSVTLTLLLADALRAHGSMRGSPLLLQHPTGSGRMVVADEVADDLVSRVVHALGRLVAADAGALVGVEALDAESGTPARPRGATGRSALPLAFLSPMRRGR